MSNDDSNIDPDTGFSSELDRVRNWLYYERDRQVENRIEMALDHAFYDNEQWNTDDAAELRERGQIPLVFNEVAAVVDWLIGTERRSRVDWNVLPRNEDHVDIADVKTKTMKYVSDINKIAFNRSRAFSDAVKGGVGWLDMGARNDPTEDILYCKYEDWRNILFDSNSYELDLSDARYIIRWRWVDEDIAIAMFPDKKNEVKAASEAQYRGLIPDDDFYLTNLQESPNVLDQGILSRAISPISNQSSVSGSRRARVKIYECQYRLPAKVKIVGSGELKGLFIHPNDTSLMEAVKNESIIDKVTNRVHFAIFTEGNMLSHNVSTYRHNRFTLTPIFAYRKNNTRLPYGAIRRVRDIQSDLNKRASKSLFMLNTNQIFYEEGALANPTKTREEVDRPDGMIEYKAGKNIQVKRDTDAATGQINLMTLDSQTIQKVVGVNNENLGRQTNAISGSAINARQNQGSVATTELFDNLRYSIQVSGEKMLSLVEQFYSEEKVIRITGAKNNIDWLTINKPEMQVDGTYRYLNDITASQADFVVSEADYNDTAREAMFEAMGNISKVMPPEIALNLYALAMEFSNLPNHDEIASRILKLTGQPDPNQKLTPEEAQQQQEQLIQQQQQQQEALQAQKEQIMLSLAEHRAKIDNINADTKAKLSSNQPNNDVILGIQKKYSDEIDRLTHEIYMLRQEKQNEILKIKADTDTKIEIANIDADTKLRIAEMQNKNDSILKQINEEVEKLLQEEKNENKLNKK